MTTQDPPPPGPDCYVECVTAHFDKLSRGPRKKGDRFFLPNASAWNRENAGLVKVIETSVFDPDRKSARGLSTKEGGRDDANPSLEDLTVAELRELAAAYGVKVDIVKPTGAGGRYKKADFIPLILAAKGARR